MGLTPGTRLGPYEITTPLGSGGAGEVYRARDTRLNRDVAIKVLRDAVRLDASRLKRFEHEARVLASLNHPNIAAIYGREEGPIQRSGQPVQALVLELVEGETLAARLTRGPVRVSEALTIARQLAEALDTAHCKGIVHRDLKPSNVAITSAGIVKVLDFGLAKITEPVEAVDRTQTIGVTRDGMVVGTSAYMSPEQARGQAVDKRTDIWAFGCVLYEMLSGRAIFARDTVTDTLAAVVDGEPDFAALPTPTPVAVRRLLQRCLKKDPRQRLRDIADARVEIEDALAGAPREESYPARPGVARRVATTAIWGGVALATVTGVTWLVATRDQASAREVTRTALVFRGAQTLDLRGRNSPLALSPDGRRLVYSARTNGRPRLYVRNLDSFEDLPLSGTEGAYHPFFSPDGRWIAFFADGKLRRVSSDGGAPIPVCDVSATASSSSAAGEPFTYRPPGSGGTWGPDDTIVFPGASGLLRVNAAGGTPVPLVSGDREIDRATHAWPQFLPDGSGLLSTVGGTIAVLSTKTGRWRVLAPGSQARFLPPGYVIFHGAGALGDGELFALSFDPNRLEQHGAAVSVLSDVFRGMDSGAAYFTLSETGTLVFAPGGMHRTLVQVDRQGRRTPMLDERRGFRTPRFSPDGRHIALSILPRPGFIWIFDLDRGAGIQFTTRGSCCPAWTPDGKRVTYQTGREVNWRSADLSGAEESLFSGSDGVQDWSPDGQILLYAHQEPTTGWDLSVVEPGGNPRTIVATPETEVAARFSPDGRWFAYMSCAFARCDVHVRPFPDVDASLFTVSTAGGGSPVWSPEGRTLYYMEGTAMMAVSIQTRDGALVAGAPTRLFDGPFDTSQVRNFDIAPDGATFAMIEADPDASPTYLQVVQNWGVELQRRLPPGLD